MNPSHFPPRLCLLLALSVLAACGENTPAVPTTPILAARGQEKGSQVTVAGNVTVVPGTFVSAMGNEGFALQDDTAGIYVKLEPKLNLRLGTRVRVTGTLKEEARLLILESDAASVVDLGGFQQIDPKLRNTGGIDETSEGLLVRATGRVTRTFEDDLPYGYKLYFDDGSGEVQIFVHASAGFDAEPLRALRLGQSVQVTGFSTQYEKIYELAPRQPSDVVPQ